MSRTAALRKVQPLEACEEAFEEDSVMPLHPPVKPSAAEERLLNSPNVRKPTRDLASIGLPAARPLRMSLTESLMLEREGRLDLPDSVIY
jgi:hypothetical protein